MAEEAYTMTEGKQLLKIAGITVAVYILMKYFLPYVIPFFISYILVHLLKPVTELIHKKLRLRREVILSVLLAALLIVCSLLFYMIYCMLMGQLKRVAMNFDDYYRCFCEGIDECCRFAERNFGVEMEEMRSFVYSGIEHATEQIRIYIVPGIFNYSMRYLKKAMDAALFLLMVFVAAILLMRDYDRMREQLRNYRLYRHVEHISGRMWHQGGMYLKAQAMIIGIVSILCVLGLWLLVPAIDGHMVPAFELMIMTPAISNMIRDNKTHQIDGIIYTSARDEMRSMDSSLLQLYHSGTITAETTLRYSTNPDMLRKKL